MDDFYDSDFDSPCRPNPGIGGVLSVLIPGLGQVYNGRLLAAIGWFVGAGIGYSTILIPGFAIHALSVWCAYRGARAWRGY
jgi:hypothetical protein